jgi:hypothetical protein
MTITTEEHKSDKVTITLNIQLQTVSEKPDKLPARCRIRREAGDKLTALSQEQTALLIYYLQKERVFLKMST